MDTKITVFIQMGSISTVTFFVIYPAYYDAFMGGEWSVDDMYPSHYFKIDNRIVFLCSRSDSFMKQEKYRKAYHQILSDKLRKHYEDFAFILVEHKDNKATLYQVMK